MRAFRVTSSAYIAVAFVLFVILNFIVAGPANAKSGRDVSDITISDITINEIEPGIGECMPGDRILVLQGDGLHEPNVQIFIHQPNMKGYVSTTILSGQVGPGLYIQVPGASWPTGLNVLKAVNSHGQFSYFSFITYAGCEDGTGAARGFGYPGIARGDG